MTSKGRKRVRFWLQPTRSFPEGAPQREDFYTDLLHDEACDIYALEWLDEYECVGCPGGSCPQHERRGPRPIFDENGNYDFAAMEAEKSNTEGRR